jgi:hypothetical protein
MPSENISERILRAWERGAGRPAASRAAATLEIIPQAERPGGNAPLFVHDAALMSLRISLLGPRLDAVVRCPGCGTEFDMPLDLSALASATPEPAIVSVEADGFAATVRPPAAQDLLALPSKGLPADAFAAALFRRCVEQATYLGRPVEPSTLPAEIRAAAAAALSERGMESPCADLTCGECGHRWLAPVDVAGVLLRDVDEWARRHLDEVHRIASAYHWSERDILALSAARRKFYLDAIG